MVVVHYTTGEDSAASVAIARPGDGRDAASTQEQLRQPEIQLPSSLMS
jgi:hypothetical protein